MDFVLIPSERYDDVIEHLRRTFFADEPLNKAVSLCRPGDGHCELERHSLSTLTDGLSVMAVTTNNEIAGVVLNGILNRGDAEQAKDNLNNIDDERFKKIFNLLYDLNLETNLFDKFGVSTMFEIRILSVDSRFRGQGLAKELMRRSEQVAKDNAFKIMKTDATGLFSQKISASLGFITAREEHYDSFTDANGEQLFRVEPPHESLKIMYKLID